MLERRVPQRAHYARVRRGRRRRRQELRLVRGFREMRELQCADAKGREMETRELLVRREPREEGDA